MKFYNPFKVSDRNGSVSLIVSIILLCFISMIFLGFMVSTIPSFYTISLFVILATIRVIYAVIKGD